MKKYIAIFKIYNGECKYTMPVGVEAKNKSEAEGYFSGYECENNNEIWKLQNFEEVKDFDTLWNYVR